ncbi:hypothetical protein [Arthrobacter sp. Soil761]|uniref:hypothetical protein n=1 Tax=Arthrobacter sp. Soil761 TaxID=1736400 RepID=UPI0006F1EA91|nr:hypothetical protein [Arthrobacter sp. Soil761]KRE76695.1 hypothetical protein ASG79_17880 [Arthrobacter sp. Soil761]
MSGRQNLAGAFAPVAPARGAALQGLLAPKRGRVAPAPEPETDEPMEAPAPTRELVHVPPAATPESADTQVPAERPQANKDTTVRAPDEEAPHEVTEERDEPTPTSVKAPKATTPQQPVAKKTSKATKASELVPGALRNVGVYLPPALLAQVKDAVYQHRTTYADLLIDAFEAVDDKQISREFIPKTTLTSSGMPRRAPRKRGEAGIQIQLRLDGLQVAWLDEKVVEFDAPSRSALVSTVFGLYIQAGQTEAE